MQFGLNHFGPKYLLLTFTHIVLSLFTFCYSVFFCIYHIVNMLPENECHRFAWLFIHRAHPPPLPLTLSLCFFFSLNNEAGTLIAYHVYNANVFECCWFPASFAGCTDQHFLARFFLRLATVLFSVQIEYAATRLMVSKHNVHSFLLPSSQLPQEARARIRANHLPRALGHKTNHFG